VNDINKLALTMCHCEQSEAIPQIATLACRNVASLLAMTTFQGRSL